MLHRKARYDELVGPSDRLQIALPHRYPGPQPFLAEIAITLSAQYSSMTDFEDSPVLAMVEEHDYIHIGMHIIQLRMQPTLSLKGM